MRIHHLILLAATACVSLPGLAAGPGSATEAASSAAPRKAWVDPTMVKNMQRVYRLDNGRTLRVSERGRKLYADLGDGPVEIVHVGHDRFEAIGTDISLSFEGGTDPHTVFARIGPQRQVASTQP